MVAATKEFVCMHGYNIIDGHPVPLDSLLDIYDSIGIALEATKLSFASIELDYPLFHTEISFYETLDRRERQRQSQLLLDDTLDESKESMNMRDLLFEFKRFITENDGSPVTFNRSAIFHMETRVDILMNCSERVDRENRTRNPRRKFLTSLYK